MRTYLEFIPPPSLWLAPLGVLFVFAGLAVVGVRRSWRLPSTSALALVWVTIGVVSLIAGRGLEEPTHHAHVIPAGVRSTGVTLLGALVLLAAAAAAFDTFRRRGVGVRAAAAVIAGVLSVPIALIASLMLACMLDLGCV